MKLPSRHNGARFRRVASIATGLAMGAMLCEVLPAGATVPVNPPQASCYDFYYWDNLTSRYENSNCGAAANWAGYLNLYAGPNAGAGTAYTRGVHDAVFFAAGHSYDFCNGSLCSGVAFLFELPNSGTLSTLVGNAQYTAQTGGLNLADVCDDAQPPNCHTQSASAGVSYAWGTKAELDEINLVVLQGCVTANNSVATSIAEAAASAGAGTVIGFLQNISFALYNDNYSEYGYAWGSRFWGDLQAGSSYGSAVSDAVHYVFTQSGSQYWGYNSYWIDHKSTAPNSLYPAQYYIPTGCLSCV